MTDFHHIKATNIDMGHGLSLEDMFTAAQVLQKVSYAIEADINGDGEFAFRLENLAEKMKLACKNKEEDIAREIIGDKTDEDGKPLTYEIRHAHGKI